jgi:hypothetical protein
MYKTALQEQNNSCAICHRPFSESVRKNIDHCHQTNKFRGVLCFQCNALLGFCRDNVTVLYSAINYLFRNDDECTP